MCVRSLIEPALLFIQKKCLIILRSIACEATGLEITRSNCQIDHIIPFKVLLENFLTEENLLDAHLEELFLYPRLHMPKEIRERCISLRQKWILYHNTNCKLRAVCSEFNLRRLRVYKGLEAMTAHDEKIRLLIRSKNKEDLYFDHNRAQKLLGIRFKADKEDKFVMTKYKRAPRTIAKRLTFYPHLTDIEEFELSRLLEMDCV